MRLIAKQSKSWMCRLAAAGGMPLLLAGFWASAQSPVPLQESSQPVRERKAPMHTPVKEEELLKRAAEASAKQDKLLEKSKAKRGGEEKRPPNTKSTLLEHSIILTDGEKFTLIPEGSILHLPEKLQAHVLQNPEGDFTFWPNFLKRNASWLTTKEVTLAMSRGDAVAAKAVYSEVSQENRAVVAVYKGGPIMILETQEEPAAETDKAAAPAKKSSFSKSLNQR
jgi:hypothetical protein